MAPPHTCQHNAVGGATKVGKAKGTGRKARRSTFPTSSHSGPAGTRRRSGPRARCRTRREAPPTTTRTWPRRAWEPPPRCSPEGAPSPPGSRSPSPGPAAAATARRTGATPPAPWLPVLLPAPPSSRRAGRTEEGTNIFYLIAVGNCYYRLHTYDFIKLDRIFPIPLLFFFVSKDPYMVCQISSANVFYMLG
ncbi:hypothetical protein PR202_gb13000 [Eleusine coracana subsp. coracana]|uniref:Uncharacterized protein n=1 Tax=Eleusine coracana subsp. coracana TaxID=191504 RepID=A0AAV5EQU3_ELECO|nr:hypothetical protein PR202_gb13000 [Eleusine coracana subsp. coracana]